MPDMLDTNNKVAEILNQYRQLLTVQYIWLTEWQEIADYLIPRKNSIAVQRIPGYKRTQKIFDSTGPHDGELLASAIHGTLTPSFTKWFHIIMEDIELQQDYNIRNWLDGVNERMRNELNKSNFNSEAHEMYIDMAFFGTGCLYEEEKPSGWWGGLRFTEVPVGRYVVAEDAFGRVDTLYRSIPMSCHAIQEKWPNTIPNELKESEKPDELWEVIHGVIPTTGNSRSAKRWESHYILYKTRTILSEKNYSDFPYMVPRWTKYSDETYGRGPSYIALPDVRTLNKLVEMELRNLAKNVDPPLLALEGEVVGPARMIPGGITVVKRGEALSKVDTAGNFQVVNLKKEELRESIHNMFMIDQLQLQTGPQMTATEVNVRYETMQRILGPTLGRMEAEFSSPCIKRTFNLMFKAGLFNPLPQRLMQAAKEKPVSMRIQYEGPLARAQRSSDLTAINQFGQTLEPFAKFDPDVIDVVDFDELVRHGADVLGIPNKAIRDKDQVQKLRDQKRQIMEEQKQNEQIEQTSQAAHNISPLIRSLHERPKPGSPMEKIVNQ